MQPRFVLAVMITTGIFGTCSAVSANQLTKYQDIKISVKQLERIAKYDHLIRFYCDNLMLYGEENRVNPNFIRALILAESNGNKNAVSVDNAYGLTQITRATGNDTAKEIEAIRRKSQIDQTKTEHTTVLHDISAENLLEPNINIFLATYLISKYNDRFDGRLDLVVAAWNAGPGAIKNDMPPNYQETLDIIGKVNGYYHQLNNLKNMGVGLLQD